jgi:microcystin-dependent protein
MGTTPPADYLACDGTIYNITDYQDLADHINTQFGSYNHFGGDGTTTFAVPDLRGEFLRGTGTNSHTNQGNGSNVGVHQDGTEMMNFILTGSTNGYMTQTFQDANYRQVANVDSKVSQSNHWVDINATTHGQQASNSIMSYTSRPTNTSVLYCIKYKNSGITYSTGEQRIGTWIDGKPLYQKTYSCTTPNASESSQQVISISSNMIVRNFIGYLGSTDGNEVPIPYYWTPTNYTSIYANHTSNTIVMRVGQLSYVSCQAYITIQYTKTTD